ARRPVFAGRAAERRLGDRRGPGALRLGGDRRAAGGSRPAPRLRHDAHRAQRQARARRRARDGVFARRPALPDYPQMEPEHPRDRDGGAVAGSGACGRALKQETERAPMSGSLSTSTVWLLAGRDRAGPGPGADPAHEGEPVAPAPRIQIVEDEALLAWSLE